MLAGRVRLTIAFFGLWEILVRAGWLKIYLYGLPSGILQRRACAIGCRHSMGSSPAPDNLRGCRQIVF